MCGGLCLDANFVTSRARWESVVFATRTRSAQARSCHHPFCTQPSCWAKQIFALCDSYRRNVESKWRQRFDDYKHASIRIVVYLYLVVCIRWNFQLCNRSQVLGFCHPFPVSWQYCLCNYKVNDGVLWMLVKHTNPLFFFVFIFILGTFYPSNYWSQRHMFARRFGLWKVLTRCTFLPIHVFKPTYS